MKIISTLALAALLAVPVACGGDDDGDGGGDQSQVDASPDQPDSGQSGAAPIIGQVSWTHTAPCVEDDRSDVVIEITATDEDTEAADLTYSGTVAGCDGNVTTNPATLSCPQLAPYNGTITVTDPEGNSDAQAITIDVCVDGSAP